jgi:hypothetical protein
MKGFHARARAETLCGGRVPPDTHELLHRMFPDFTGDLCPICHARLVTVQCIRPGRSPPWEHAA